MELMEAMKTRHSVRQYTDRPIPAEAVAALRVEIDACNRAGGLHIQLVTDEPAAFGGRMAHYGKFSNVRNYIALIGPKGQALDETLGYYGERIALRAQQLGLNTCWVALTYSRGKSRCTVAPGEKLVCVLTVGYGSTQGVPHKSKPMDAVCRSDEPTPDWFRRGAEAALLAPTAMNQQKFLLTRTGEKVTAKATGGFYSKIDLGIVKYHFELGSGRDSSVWA